MDWLSSTPYVLLTFIILLCIGLYALITGKTVLRVIFGVELLFSSANILLLALAALRMELSGLQDVLPQVFSIFILVVNFVLFVVGLTIERRLRQAGAAVLIDFNFELEEEFELQEEPEKDFIGEPEIFSRDSSSQKGGTK
ncbi:MAG: NADH-quinone oxidoreductase subunit K [Candidatus Heimdallarchaeota archaeon]|nr:NADH-quinone oxidoreductase subunit K [Candidatus Heimdallarchaeota archaeon]